MPHLMSLETDVETNKKHIEVNNDDSSRLFPTFETVGAAELQNENSTSTLLFSSLCRGTDIRKLSVSEQKQKYQTHLSTYQQ